MLAAGPKRAALLTAPLWRRAIGATERDYSEDQADTQRPRPGDARSTSTPSPPATCANFVEAARLRSVRVKGEELLANMHGWTMRTLEATAVPEEVPWGWRKFAFRSYLALQKVDNAVLEPYLPPQVFYNLVLSGRKP